MMASTSTSQSTPNAWGLLLLRIIVGWVFLSEGIQKFLYPASLGVGTFTKIGISALELAAPFVGVVEIVLASC